MSRKNLELLLLTLLSFSLSQVSSVKSALSDDSVTEATFGSSLALNDNIRHELNKMSLLLVRYGAQYYTSKDLTGPDRHYWFAIPTEISAPPLTNESAFIQSEILSSNSIQSSTPHIRELSDPEFDRVLDLYPECRVHVIGEELPSGSSSHELACTIGKKTWIRGSIFRRLTPRKQALSLLHERLHGGILDGAPEEFAADMTDSVDLMLTIQEKQSAGDRTPLNEGDKLIVNRFIKRIAQLGLSEGRPDLQFPSGDENTFVSNWQVSSGGGFVETTFSKGKRTIPETVSKSAFIGIGSIISVNTHIGDDAIILNTTCYSSPHYYYLDCDIRKNAFVKNVSFIPGIEAEYWRKVGKDLIKLDNIIIGESASIEDVSLTNFHFLTLESGAKFSNVSLLADPYFPLEKTGNRRRLPPTLVLREKAHVKGISTIKITSPEKSSLQFEAHTYLDFLNEPICSQNQKLSLFGTNTISSSDDLKKLCTTD